MDRSRITAINTLLFRHLAKEKKFALDPLQFEAFVQKGVEFGFKETHMRSFVAEFVLKQANLTCGRVLLFKKTSNLNLVSTQIREDIESVFLFESLRSKRAKIDKRLVEGFVKECLSLGITEEEAREYLRIIINKLVEEAFA